MLAKHVWMTRGHCPDIALIGILIMIPRESEIGNISLSIFAYRLNVVHGTQESRLRANSRGNANPNLIQTNNYINRVTTSFHNAAYINDCCIAHNFFAPWYHYLIARPDQRSICGSYSARYTTSQWHCFHPENNKSLWMCLSRLDAAAAITNNYENKNMWQIFISIPMMHNYCRLQEYCLSQLQAQLHGR